MGKNVCGVCLPQKAFAGKKAWPAGAKGRKSALSNQKQCAPPKGKATAVAFWGKGPIIKKEAEDEAVFCRKAPKNAEKRMTKKKKVSLHACCFAKRRR